MREQCKIYVCISRYPLVSKKIRKKIQVTQNKWIRFCLKLISRRDIGIKEFKEQKDYQQKKVDQREIYT